MKLLYKSPAKGWLEGLPLGNGRIGAMLYGTPEHEVIQINEDTLWSGSPYNGQKGMSPEAVRQAGILAKKGNYQEAKELLEQQLKESEDVQVYLPFGEIHLERPVGENGKISGYKRYLNLEQAAVFEEYYIDQTFYTVTCFISAPDQGLVWQIKASEPFSLRISGKGGFLKEKKYQRQGFILKGICPGRSGFQVIKENSPEEYVFPEDPRKQGIHYIGQAAVICPNGTVDGQNDGIWCKNTTMIELHLAIRTSFRDYEKAYPLQYTDKELENMLAQDLSNLSKSFDRLFKAHVREYHSYYSRTSFTLEGANFEELDLIERLNRFQDGTADLGLYTLLFAYGKYLLISASRPGTQPANLQGIWNQELVPPWFCDYTVNINTQMNYWMTGPLELPEMLEPFVKLNMELMQSGKKTAQELLGSEGTACFHNTDLWRKTSPATGQAVWAFWPFGSAWMCRNLFDEYLFTEDEEYLKKIYPVLEENVKFCLQQLVKTAKGLAICPATSPENLFFEDCSVGEYSENTLAITRNLFRDYLEASKVLNQTSPLIPQVRHALENIVPTALGSKGQILEWNEEFPEQDIHHRHLSHLYELHPGRGITKDTPKLYLGAKNSLKIRGNDGTGWSLAWKVMMWARMENGVQVEKILKNLFYLVDPWKTENPPKGGIYPNLFCAHPPFQIDGNLGYTAAVAEILVQSHGNELVLLPALPPAWKAGKATGLKARKNIRIDIQWNKKEVRYTLTSQKDLIISLRIGTGPVQTCSIQGQVPYHGTVLLERV